MMKTILVSSLLLASQASFAAVKIEGIKDDRCASIVKPYLTALAASVYNEPASIQVSVRETEERRYKIDLFQKGDDKALESYALVLSNDSASVCVFESLTPWGASLVYGQDNAE